MKILKWISNNILSVFTIFLLAFIPLYPKIPLVDIQHTWVYIRFEDFAVVAAIITWIVLLLLRKVTLKTPLTIPILFFWVIGGLATLHGVMLLFPTLSGLFSNVALLSFLRRIEYIFLFFIAFAGIKDKKSIVHVAVTLSIVLLLVAGYGFGQKYLGFPAFLTMNEEFAKGIPIQLSALSRVPSTFAGQYDLAAYLVLVIPILVSLAFGFKNILFKIFLFITSSLGFVLLFMTVSRISFFALLLSLLILLILQRKKLIIISLLVLTAILLIFSPSLLQRFKSTVSEVDVLVDAGTGGAIGQVKQVPTEYFKDKVVKIPVSNADTLKATASAILPYSLIPPVASLVIEANNSTGETLPQGTSYVNLPLSPVIKKVNQYYFQKLITKSGVESEELSVLYGDFLIKKARAYDLSFTTRFQGEWPNTFSAFKRNILLGSGYGSVSLAVDNDYLRILGESGLLGIIAFLSIFITAGIYIKKLLPKVDSPIAKSFIIGFVAGSFGLGINASLIDVFEASKIAFTYWLLMGTVIGTLYLYGKEEIDVFKEFKKVVASPVAVIIYILISVVVIFSPIYSNYFTGDDFTWLRWASNCCSNVVNYFTQANGFFYRPGTKLYFSIMYSAFWLNQTMYHFVSIFLQFAVSSFLFLVLKKILKNYLLSITCVALFIILSVHHEDVLWISSTGFLFNALFALTGLLSFIYYKEKKKIIYFVISLISIIFSLFFHEMGVIVPLLIILYDYIFEEKSKGGLSGKINYLILLSPIVPYLELRFLASSHWLSGDYSYNLFKLPYNILGNSIGYLSLDLFGPQSLSFYEILRNSLKSHILIALPLFLLVIFGFIMICKVVMRRLEESDQKIVVFGFWFFIIALLPFLGLGNITSRYSYLSSIGFVIIVAVFLKQTYIYIASNSSKYIGVACIVIIMTVYFMVQLFGLQKLHSDWRSAGDESQRLLVSVEEHSQDSWIAQKTQFYFVNPPIKNGEAWVWPVGLQDAIWFTFKNPNLIVYIASNANSAFDQATGSSNAHVFVFDALGNVDELVRGENGKIYSLNNPK
jgi:protein O-mannosyl-transferase